jgi:hypothetical protein
VPSADVAQEPLGRRVDPPDDAVRVENVARDGNTGERLLDVAADRALEVADPGAASRIWRRVDHDVVRLAPWVFMQNELQTTLVSRRVGNYQYNPQWGPLLDQLWVR